MSNRGNEWLTLRCDILDICVVSVGHVTQIREDDKSREQTCERVDDRRAQTVPIVAK